MAKVENNAKGKVAKIALRERALAFVAEAGPVRVFDAFAGSGTMWREVWKRADDYVGCDVRPIYDPQRALYVAECERVMRAIDLSAFNVFDLDAFGSPWLQAYLLSVRRRLAPGERVAILTTDGAKLSARFNNNLEPCFAHLAQQPGEVTGVHQLWPALTRAALTRVGELMGGALEWCEVRDGFGPSACQAYSGAGYVGRAGAGIVAQEPSEGAGEALAGVPVAETTETPVAALGADCAPQE